MPRTEVRGVEFEWSRSGQGPTTIWGHGLHGSRDVENRYGVIDHATLADHLDLVRYDARGHGESTTTTERSTYSWDQMAQDQLALADALGIGTYVAAGASLGTATAIHAAVLAPDRIAKLVLVIPPTAWETRAQQVDLYERMARIAETKGTEPLIRALDQGPVPDPVVDDADWFDNKVNNLRAVDPQRLAIRLRGAGTADLPPRELVGHIEAPTLILAWSGDSGHPVDTAEQLHDLIAHSQMVVSSTAADYRTWTARMIEFINS
ncbi:MAG: alpha/beta fold hydrolase [Acidimicrobiales bacterium]|nr:alpha/beta fold hydrolase [Acidimicrobiales bacterium]